MGLFEARKKSCFALICNMFIANRRIYFSFLSAMPNLIFFCYYFITLSQSQKTIRSLIAFHSAQRTASVPVKVQLVSAE